MNRKRNEKSNLHAIAKEIACGFGSANDSKSFHAGIRVEKAIYSHVCHEVAIFSGVKWRFHASRAQARHLMGLDQVDVSHNLLKWTNFRAISSLNAPLCRSILPIFWGASSLSKIF